MKNVAKFAFGVGHVFNDLCACMWFTYFLVFYTECMQFSDKTAGILLMAGQFFDGLATVFTGFESDRATHGLCGYGRRKTWHLGGSLLVVLSFNFLYIKCIGCESVKPDIQFWYYLPFVCIFQFGWAAVQISHLSLVPDLTKSENVRVTLNSIRYAGTVCSNIFVLGLAWLLLSKPIMHHSKSYLLMNPDEQLNPSDAPTFMYMSLIILGVGLLFTLLFHCCVPESNSTMTSEALTLVSNTPSRNWKFWLKKGNFYMVCIIYMLVRVSLNFSQTFLNKFIIDTLGFSKVWIAVCPLAMYGGSFLSSIVVSPISKFLGRKGTLAIGALLISSSCVWLYFTNDEYQMVGICVILGMGCTFMLVISQTLGSDLLGNDTNAGAFVFGCMSLFDKLANGLLIFIVTQMKPCETKCVFYRYVMTFIPLGMAITAMLLYLPVKFVHAENITSPQQSQPEQDDQVYSVSPDTNVLIND